MLTKGKVLCDNDMYIKLLSLTYSESCHKGMVERLYSPTFFASTYLERNTKFVLVIRGTHNQYWLTQHA